MERQVAPYLPWRRFEILSNDAQADSTIKERPGRDSTEVTRAAINESIMKYIIIY